MNTNPAHVLVACDSSASNQSASSPHPVPPKAYPDRMKPAVAAEYLGVKESTLATWRSTRRYALAYIKVGRLIFYSKTALDKFVASRTITLAE